MQVISKGLQMLFDESIPFDVWMDTTDIIGLKERITLLIGYKIQIPFAPIASDPAMKQVYLEGIRSYVYGLPNASIPMMLRFFELVCKREFRRIENKPDADPKLEDLINWTERYLKEKTTAHGFQALRNLIHTDKLLEDPDALEAIRHISIITNKMWFFDKAKVLMWCETCQQYHTYEIPPQAYILGKSWRFPPCQNKTNASYKKINL